jgi:hypothetical protein
MQDLFPKFLIGSKVSYLTNFNFFMSYYLLIILIIESKKIKRQKFYKK